MNIKKIAVIWKNSPDMIKYNQFLIQLIKSKLNDSEVNDYDGHKITEEDLADVNGVINLAGDGHFLNAARYILKPEQFMVGFTFDQSNSYGHYNKIRGTAETFIDFLERLNVGDVKQNRYKRLDVFINGKVVDIVLNEVWEKSVSGASLRHHVRINGVEGSYLHGGFGVSTASGRSGLVGRINPLEVDLSISSQAIIYRAMAWTTNYQEIIRERTKGISGDSIYDGIIPEGKSIFVTSNNRVGSAHIVCDGRHELLPNPRVYAFDKGSVLEVKQSEKDLLYVY